MSRTIENLNCFGCWTSMPQRITPALWVTRDGDRYCTACLAAEGIEQADCVRGGRCEHGPSAAVATRTEATRNSVGPAPARTEPAAPTPAGIAPLKPKRDCAPSVRVACLNPKCTGTRRAQSKYLFCSVCINHGFHRGAPGKLLMAAAGHASTLQLNPTSTKKGTPHNRPLATGEIPKTSPVAPTRPEWNDGALDEVPVALETERVLAGVAVGSDLLDEPDERMVRLELTVPAAWLDRAWQRLTCDQKARALAVVLAE
jgi:hypothetical protein